MPNSCKHDVAHLRETEQGKVETGSKTIWQRKKSCQLCFSCPFWLSLVLLILWVNYGIIKNKINHKKTSGVGARLMGPGTQRGWWKHGIQTTLPPPLPPKKDNLMIIWTQSWMALNHWNLLLYQLHWLVFYLPSHFCYQLIWWLYLNCHCWTQ